MNADEKTAFVASLKSDAAFRDQVRAALREPPRARARFVDDRGVHDFGEGEEARRAERAAERARVAALRPPPDTRRRSSDAIDLTGGRPAADA